MSRPFDIDESLIEADVRISFSIKTKNTNGVRVRLMRFISMCAWRVNDIKIDILEKK